MLSVVGVVMCGKGWKLDLEGLAKHDRIEHDASLTHDDAAPGAAYAPTAVDSKLLQALLQQSSDGRGLTLQDLTKARAARDASLKKPLDGFHDAIAQGEVALTFELFKDAQGEVPKEAIRQWFGEQKFPDGWTRPSRTIGLWNTTMTTQKVATSVKELDKEASKKKD
ncbi:putative heme-thiolate peroxidase [Hericium alpestre]|uniref:Putative heme-thiolate peroxidase n=1 Tax=Hericium alpestre TaxID=135208 RepID=A0A4Z0A4X9_9AGAM|nr:putative heme-thiolate peroxidase [Hericium alpestre]